MSGGETPFGHGEQPAMRFTRLLPAATLVGCLYPSVVRWYVMEFVQKPAMPGGFQDVARRLSEERVWGHSAIGDSRPHAVYFSTV